MCELAEGATSSHYEVSLHLTHACAEHLLGTGRGHCPPLTAGCARAAPVGHWVSAGCESRGNCHSRDGSRGSGTTAPPLTLTPHLPVLHHRYSLSPFIYSPRVHTCPSLNHTGTLVSKYRSIKRYTTISSFWPNICLGKHQPATRSFHKSWIHLHSWSIHDIKCIVNKSALE